MNLKTDSGNCSSLEIPLFTRKIINGTWERCQNFRTTSVELKGLKAAEDPEAAQTDSEESEDEVEEGGDGAK